MRFSGNLVKGLPDFPDQSFANKFLILEDLVPVVESGVLENGFHMFLCDFGFFFITWRSQMLSPINCQCHFGAPEVLRFVVRQQKYALLTGFFYGGALHLSLSGRLLLFSKEFLVQFDTCNFLFFLVHG
jgi:hypothetical protein